MTSRFGRGLSYVQTWVRDCLSRTLFDVHPSTEKGERLSLYVIQGHGTSGSGKTANRKEGTIAFHKRCPTKDPEHPVLLRHASASLKAVVPKVEVYNLQTEN